MISASKTYGRSTPRGTDCAVAFWSPFDRPRRPARQRHAGASRQTRVDRRGRIASTACRRAGLPPLTAFILPDWHHSSATPSPRLPRPRRDLARVELPPLVSRCSDLLFVLAQVSHGNYRFAAIRDPRSQKHRSGAGAESRSRWLSGTRVGVWTRSMRRASGVASAAQATLLSAQQYRFRDMVAPVDSAADARSSRSAAASSLATVTLLRLRLRGVPVIQVPNCNDDPMRQSTSCRVLAGEASDVSSPPVRKSRPSVLATFLAGYAPGAGRSERGVIADALRVMSSPGRY